MSLLPQGRSVILIVDDLAANIDFLTEILSSEADIRFALSGFAALEIARKYPIDLIILDVMMPGMDGFEVCRRLKENPVLQKIPIIFVTADADPKAEQKALAAGGEDLISKPVNIAATRARVHILLERERLRKKLEFELEKIKVTLQSIGEGVITTNIDGLIEYMNPVAEKLVGWKLDEASGMPLHQVFDYFNGEGLDRSENLFDQCLRCNRVVDAPLNAMMTDHFGNEIAIDSSAAPIRNNEGRTIGVVIVFRDTSSQRLLARQLSYQATHDPLTGLVNRGEFERRLEQAVNAAGQSCALHSLLYIDLDQFKLVNDACGHSVGDRLLKQVTSIIHGCIRNEDTLARLGGDEFAVILQDCSLKPATRIAEGICKQVDEFRFSHGNRRFRIGASIGLVVMDQVWAGIGEVLQAADSACYAAKEGGRNRVQNYSELGLQLSHHRGQVGWAVRIADAIDQGSFVLFAQQISGANSVGDQNLHCEVLLRLMEPDGSLSPPGAFISAAERFHMAGLVDKWVIQKVLSTLDNHRNELGNIGRISINLSGQSIGDREFQQYIEKLLMDSNVDLNKLCFEVTETSAIERFQDAAEFMKRMRQLGIKFSLDDFGSGLSSFGYLKKLPVDYIKIDGLFVRNIVDDPVNFLTVRCIYEIARSLGKFTVAEFVENEEIRRVLLTIGVDYMQGYLLHKPEIFENLLARFIQK